MLHVVASRAMAALAPDIPFRNGLARDIVIDGVAPVAERASRTLHVVRRVERRPPIGAISDEIGPPDLVRDVPLGGKNEIVIADFLEIALFPNAPIDERYIAPFECDQGVGFR